MSKPAINLANDFIAHQHRLEMTRCKMEDFFSHSQITQYEIELMYGGLCVKMFTRFEELLEELFFGLLSNNVLPSSNVVPTIPATCSVMVKDILLIGEDYLIWLLYKHTLARAELFFKNGEPFTRLGSTHKSKLRDSLYIRNAIAHKSQFALEQFEKHVIGNKTFLTPREQTPTGFLRSQFRSNPTLTRYQDIDNNLRTIATILCQ